MAAPVASVSCRSSAAAMCWCLCAGNDNLLLSVGEAIEALLPLTPPPPPPACAGCEPIAGQTHSHQAPPFLPP